MTVDRCYGLAVVELGVSPSEFWKMTPRQFAAGLDAKRKHRAEEIKRADRRAGEVVAMLYNTNRDPKKTTQGRPEDWFPSLRQPGGSQQDPDQVWAQWQSFVAGHNRRIEA